MARKKGVMRTLKDADDVLRLLTGKRFSHISARAFDLWIRPRLEKAAREVPAPDARYALLEVSPGCGEFVLKAAYRAQMRLFHPDGTHPNEEMAKAINEAYESICQERGIPK